MMKPQEAMAAVEVLRVAVEVCRVAPTSHRWSEQG